MKKTLFLTLLVVLWNCKEKPQENEVAKNLKTYTIEQMMDNENVGGGSFSPDLSTLLVTSNRSGIYNMYTVPVNGGEFQPVTESDSSSVFAISYFPEDERMLFRMDNNGDEIYHIFLREEDGTYRDLTPYEGARSLFYGWADDEKGFFFGSNKRDSRFIDLYKVDLETFTPELLYQNEQGYDIGAISRDEKYLTLSKALNTNDGDLYLYDLESGSQVKINESQSANSAQDFTPDSSALLYTTDEGSEFSYVMRYDISDGTREKVMERDWDINGTYFTRTGKYRVTYINEDAKNSIEVEEVATGEPMTLPAIGDMDITSVSFSDDDSLMRFFAGGSNSPSDLYVYDITSGEQRKLTDVLNKEIQPQDLVKAEVIRYPSFDGLE
ncbi:TolB family protein, partial [Muriicola sp.]|uniref:TolB family protein n=1 Tax=Muriicola sp. TaxID=2020856 RepID=UPI00356AA9AB